MKIVHCTGFFQPWLGYQEYFLAKKQSELGHEVYVLTSDRHAPFHHFSKATGSLFDTKKVESGYHCERGVRVYRLPCLIKFGYAVLVRKMKDALQQIKPDIVHVHEVQHLSPFIPLLFKDAFSFPVVLDNHAYGGQKKDPAYGKEVSFLGCLGILYHKLFRMVLGPYVRKKVDAYISVSPFCRAWFSKEYGVNYDHIIVIPLGADATLFRKDLEAREKTRRELGIENDEILVIYAGKITPGKNIELLVRAIAPLIHENKKLKLLLIGSVEKGYLAKLERVMKEQKILSNAIFHGLVANDKLNNYYNAGDIGVWPGSTSITIWEAMAAGLPVILPRSETTKHLLEYDNALTFAPRDLTGLRGALEKLLHDSHLRSKLSHLSRKLIEDKYSWNVLAKRTLKIYEKTLQNFERTARPRNLESVCVKG